MVSSFWSDRKRVVMTGFGPMNIFYKTNPSWEGVKLMDGREIENKYDITLFRKEIGVKYSEVDTVVPQMWHYYQPHLTIHVGVNDLVESFVLEKKAYKGVYVIRDYDRKLPEKHFNAGPPSACTTLNVESICRKFNNSKRMLRDPTLRATSSDEAGKYLCEYIYYTSLCQGQGPALFVHVPSEKYTSEQLAYGLERILELCLKQLSKDHDDDGYYSYDVDIDNKL